MSGTMRSGRGDIYVQAIRGLTIAAVVYVRAFLANACIRPSCFSCHFKRRCGSDVTLGDFWGVGSARPEEDSSGGVFAVICNTGRGAALAAASGSLA